MTAPHLNRRTMLTAGAAAIALPAVAVAADDQSAALTKFLDAQYEAQLQFDPEDMTSQGRRDRYGELTDRSEAHGDKVLAWQRKSVAEMRAKFDPSKLNEDARTSYEVWALELDRAEKARQWRRHRYMIGRGGTHTGLPNFMITQHRVETRVDMDAYISRLNAIGAALDQVTARAQENAAARVHMPQWEYDRSISEIQRLTTGAPFGPGADSALFADAKAKIAALKLDAATSARLTKQASDAMTGKMKPAYDRMVTWLKADRANASADAKGVGALPNGKAYYDAALYLQTTTDMTAEEIHALGLSEVARIRGEMEAVKQKAGFTGSLAEFFVFMRTDKRFYLPNTDAGRQQYLTLADGYLSNMKKKLPQYFGVLPKADLVVKRVEAFREEPGGAQHYQPGTPDGSRPGTFYAHLSDMNAMPTYQLENIAYHEGLPGHHMQISIAQELKGVAKFRTQLIYGAYVEGWGLYSEALAKEMGFDTDPYNDFGRLSGEIWRAIRLVLDTGIHAKGWSEEQSVKYFTENSAQPEAAIRSEVRRYFMNPGQACCYKIGMIRLQKLRDEARAKQGAKFDYRPFHDQVLAGGSLPIPVLEARVRRWMARA